MSLDTLEEIQNFISMANLSVEQLQKKCIEQKINPENKNKNELIKLICKLEVKEKEENKVEDKSFLQPQGIPLRSKYRNGNPIDGTSETYKKWRSLIFQTKGNNRKFFLQNKDGKQYSTDCFYIRCKPETALSIIENKWHSVYDSQKITIEKILENPQQFEFSIIRKSNSNGHNFLMLHCNPRAMDQNAAS